MPIDDTVDVVEAHDDVQHSPGKGIPCPTGVVSVYQKLGASTTRIIASVFFSCFVSSVLYSNVHRKSTHEVHRSELCL